MEKEKKEISTTFKSAVRFYVLLSWAVYLLCGGAYFLGVSSYYGKTLGLGGAIECILEIFNIKELFYKNGMGILLGILYVVFFCLLIKKAWDMSNATKNVFKNLEKEDCYHYLLTLNGVLGKSLKMIISYIVVCGLVKEYPLPLFAKGVFLLAIVDYLATRILLWAYVEEYTWQYIGGETLRCGAYGAAIIAIFLLLQSAHIENLIMQIPMFFRLMSVSFRALVLLVGEIATTIISIVVIVKLLYFIGEIYEYGELQSAESDLKELNSLIYIAIALFIINVAALIVAGMSPNVETVLAALKRSVPMLCVCAAVRVLNAVSVEEK